MPPAAGEKYLVLKGKAGMGNRLLVLLEGILYSEMTSRKLVVDWSDRAYSGDRSNSFPRLLDSPASLEIDAVAAADSVYPPAWKGHLDQSVDEMLRVYEPDNDDADEIGAIVAKYTIDPSVADYQEDVVVRWAFVHELYKMKRHAQGKFEYLRHLADDVILRKVIREALVPCAEVRERVDDLRSKHFGDKAIGLHIRHTDRKNSFEGYEKFVDRFLRRNPKGAVFLATDNIDVETYFKQRYPHVVAAEKWYPEPGQPIHRNLDNPDKLASAREALIDMYLLSKCDFLVYNGTSSFGLFARLLSDIPSSESVDLAPFSMKRQMKQAMLWLRSRGLFE